MSASKVERTVEHGGMSKLRTKRGDVALRRWVCLAKAYADNDDGIGFRWCQRLAIDSWMSEGE
eukprot:1510833-Pyramimonas_sp.AAC.1